MYSCIMNAQFVGTDNRIQQQHQQQQRTTPYNSNTNSSHDYNANATRRSCTTVADRCRNVDNNNNNNVTTTISVDTIDTVEYCSSPIVVLSTSDSNGVQQQQQPIPCCCSSIRRKDCMECIQGRSSGTTSTTQLQRDGMNRYERSRSSSVTTTAFLNITSENSMNGHINNISVQQQQQQSQQSSYRKVTNSSFIRRNQSTNRSTIRLLQHLMVLTTTILTLSSHIETIMNLLQCTINTPLYYHHHYSDTSYMFVQAATTITATVTANNVLSSSNTFSSLTLQHQQLSVQQQQRKLLQQYRRTQGQQEKRTLLVIRILDAPESELDQMERHGSLRSVLFDGGASSVENEVLASVQQQMRSCSGNAILFVPQFIPNYNDNFIVDIVVPTNGISNPFNPNEWVEVMGEIASVEGPLKSMMDTATVPDDSTEPFYTLLLRQLADHVIIILPESFPDADFLATGEISNTITIYAVQWATSLSTYMHELAHNLGLRHSGDSGDTIRDTEYGDSSGYMGQSFITPWTPQKCYNAAQHWQLGWFQQQRLTFIETTTDDMTPVASFPLRVNVAAFVDYGTLADEILEPESYVILVQILSNVYLQFNCAKSYNVGTDPIYANEIVIIEQLDDLTTRVLASLQSQESFTILTGSSSSGIIIHVCDIIITTDTTNTDFIDFAILAISDSHTNDDITSVCQNGPEYVAPIQPPTANTQVDPTQTPIVNIPSPSPTIEPVVDEPIETTPPSVSIDEDKAPVINIPVSVSEPNDSDPPTKEPTRVDNVDGNDPDDKDDDDGILKTAIPTAAPTSFPSVVVNLRGPVPSGSIGNNNTSTTITDKSSSSGGLTTSSVIYTAFGSIVGVILISMLVLFYLSKHQSSKSTSNLNNGSTTSSHHRRRSTSSRSDSSKKSRNGVQKQHLRYSGTGSQTDNDISPDGSPTYIRTSSTRSKLGSSEHKANEDQNSATRSKRSVTSNTSIPTKTITSGTKSSSQNRDGNRSDPKNSTGAQQVAVGTVLHNSSGTRNKSRSNIQGNADNESSDDDDDDKSETLSVILQQEILKERVHKILKNVFVTQDHNGTPHMMTRASASTANR